MLNRDLFVSLVALIEILHFSLTYITKVLFSLTTASFPDFP